MLLSHLIWFVPTRLSVVWICRCQTEHTPGNSRISTVGPMTLHGCSCGVGLWILGLLSGGDMSGKRMPVSFWEDPRVLSLKPVHLKFFQWLGVSAGSVMNHWGLVVGWWQLWSVGAAGVSVGRTLNWPPSWRRTRVFSSKTTIPMVFSDLAYICSKVFGFQLWGHGSGCEVSIGIFLFLGLIWFYSNLIGISLWTKEILWFNNSTSIPPISKIYDKLIKLLQKYRGQSAFWISFPTPFGSLSPFRSDP